MANLREVARRLGEDGTVWCTPTGSSMTPRIRSGERVRIELWDPEDIHVGDVVLVLVRGVTRLHLVTAVDRARRRLQISNNHGHVNGWAGYEKVYGKMTGKE